MGYQEMMMLSEMVKISDGKLIGNDLKVSSVSIDTRTITKGGLYIAIIGKRLDGHDFIDEAERAGANSILVEHEVETELSQVVVKDSHLALAQIAGAWKSKQGVKTIAVTGSNGKTTVKEMIAAILEVDAKVLATKGNFNNDIGVPLTLLRLKEQHQYAVIEMGANHVGEIKYSCQYAQPDVSVITNVSAAHIEGFGSIEGIARAKGEIIQSLSVDGISIINRDDQFYDLWQGLAENKKKISFGLHENADIRAENISAGVVHKKFKTKFVLTTENEQIAIQLRLAGQHNVVNALAAAASCLSLGVGLQQIKQGLESVSPVTGRLQALIGKQGGLVIDDTYNANPGSVKAALDVLMECEGEPWVILGALAEMGSESVKIHKELGELIKSKKVVRLMTIGSDAESTSHSFGRGATFFNSQQQLIDVLNMELKGSEVVLIKGSRGQKMENIVAALVTDFRK